MFVDLKHFRVGFSKFHQALRRRESHSDARNHQYQWLGFDPHFQ